jgi:TATA-binding protein-associated factor
MGLGKTLEALTAVALSHHGAVRADTSAGPVSLVVCPSTLVGHWLAEIHKFFPGQKVLRGTSNIGRLKQWSETTEFNMVVVSYSILRREIDNLSKINWHYCILDEGHLLKNPKTGTSTYASSFKLLRAPCF